MPSRDWSQNAHRLYDDLQENAPAIRGNDLLADAYYLGWHDNTASMSERREAREAVKNILRDEYGYDFDALFNWQDWREHYGEDF